MRLGEKPGDLLPRSKQFALRVIRFYVALPKTTEAQVIGRQALRSGTSVGAQLAEAAFAKSRADFINKIEGALQEMQETRYWLELVVEAGIVKPSKLSLMLDEAKELTAIMATIAGKSKQVTKK